MRLRNLIIDFNQLFGANYKLRFYIEEDITRTILSIAENPAFISLKEDEGYNLLVKKLKGKLDGEDECINRSNDRCAFDK